MAYKVIILYQLYMPSYFLGTFTEYPQVMLTFEFRFALQLLLTKSLLQNLHFEILEIFRYECALFSLCRMVK